MSSGNGLITIGNQVYKVNLVPVDNRQFDREQTVDGKNVERIDVYSEIADVKISSSLSSTVSAHLHGDAFIIGDINFTINVNKGLLSIELLPMEEYVGTTLSLDICVPYKIYEEVSVKTSKAKNITISDDISAKDIFLKSEDGALFSNATFSNISLVTSRGITELHISPKEDIFVTFSTDSGPAFLDFSNLGNVNLSTFSSMELIHNNHKSGSGYDANVKISTSKGSILIT